MRRMNRKGAAGMAARGAHDAKTLIRSAVRLPNDDRRECSHAALHIQAQRSVEQGYASVVANFPALGGTAGRMHEYYSATLPDISAVKHALR